MTTGKYKGKWQIRIQPTNRVTKERINVTPQYASTKREAAKIEHKMWNEYNAGFDFETSKHMFTDEFDRYVKRESKMDIGVIIQLRHGTTLTGSLSNTLKM